jgi:PTH1 family peptidyl-tRNA hydrolase
MKCVIGLGNPGRRYRGTRHNAGYMVVSEVAGRFSVSFSEPGFSEVATAVIPDAAGAGPGIEVLLVKPLTYMNASGQAVSEVLRDYPVALEDILVVHDDMDLPFGKIRIRRRGSAGGHKGIESIAAQLGTCDFARLKVGIGRPPAGVDPVDYVLEPFPEEEAQGLAEMVRLSAQAAIDVFRKGIEQAMAEYNGKDTLEENG